ncbi:MAG: hypothetical protein ACKVIQ_06435 [Acidimicrobiales bacterium]
MSEASFDVVIIGGGLADSSLASILPQRGLQVLVLAPETGFRDRV